MERASPHIRNSIIAGNSAASGGGIKCSSSSPTIINCTITENSANVSGGGMSSYSYLLTLMVNCILWNNTPEEIGGSPSVIYSCIKGGYEGEGNINENPLFFNPTGGDYHLQSGSLCIDAGTQEGAPVLDLDGNLRESKPDMGAYEFGTAPPPPLEADITVNPINGLITTEDGDTAEFTMVLNIEPIANVEIETISSDYTEGGRYPTSLIFTPGNWDIPQIITITGIDDEIGDGDIEYTIITYPAISDDPDYSGFDAKDISVINIDNEPLYPIIISTTPVNNANEIPTDTTIIANFSKSMDCSRPIALPLPLWAPLRGPITAEGLPLLRLTALSPNINIPSV